MYHGNVLMKADTEIIVHTTILPQPSTPGMRMTQCKISYFQSGAECRHTERGIAKRGRGWEGDTPSHEGGFGGPSHEILGANGAFSCILSLLFSLLLVQWLHRF